MTARAARNGQPPVAGTKMAGMTRSLGVPVVALLASVACLAALAATVGVGPLGWAVGLGCTACVVGTAVRALWLRAAPGWGPADQVTLGRALLVSAVAALTVESYLRPPPTSVVVTLAVAALVLDAVDGVVARRTRTTSAFGAKFDGEVDALLILVLCVYVAPVVGGWVLAGGIVRYAFAAAGWVFPWLRCDLPERYWRKVVTAVEGIALAVAAAGILPRWVSVAGLVVASALLAESFGRDVLWLWRARTVQPRGRRHAAATLAEMGKR